MATTQYPQIDYTSRDYASFKQDMVNLINSKVPEWTNLSESDMGVVLVELFCHVADALAYYQDRQANEAYLPTAQLRASVINLCKLIDYKLSGLTPSTSTVTLTITPDPINTRVIPVGSLVSTEPTDIEPAVYFEFLTGITVLPGVSTIDALLTEGQSIVEGLGTSNGLAAQTFELTQNNVILPSDSNPNAIIIEVDEGSGYVAWTRVDTIVTAGPTDKIWYFSEDENGVVTIFFGDGVNGKIASAGSPIQATYRYGGGIRGNVGSGTISVLANVPSYVTACTNAANATGGDDRETIEHARAFAPASIRQLNRAVTEEDYLIVAQDFPGVLKAGIFVNSTYVGTQVSLYILPVGGGVPSPALLAAVKTYIDSFKMATVVVNTFPAVEAQVDLTMTVKALPTTVNADVQASVIAAMETFLAPGAFDFGQRVNMSDVYRIIEAIDGVDYIDLNRMTLSPLLTVGRETGNPTWSDFSVTPAITTETWTVRMTSPTAFIVIGSVSGLQTNTGTTNVLYTTDSGGLSFKIVPGVSPVVINDWWEIRTTVYVGNININSLEVPVLGALTVTVTGGL